MYTLTSISSNKCGKVSGVCLRSSQIVHATASAMCPTCTCTCVIYGTYMAITDPPFISSSGKVSTEVQIRSDSNEQYSILEAVKEQIQSLPVRVYLVFMYLRVSLSLLKRRLHCSSSLVYRKCSKKTVTESVASLLSLLSSVSGRTGLRVVMMTVFVNQMLLMRAGDVERNPGPGEGG